ncbi:MAG: DEAD/DEAH box helicase, partial [Rhodospirillaceae bacterium]|nr:DEAD/DEAH box helicase [Rhodospirillaceae bacterium]
SQSVREWTADTETPLRSFAVCSDSQVGKRRQSNTDVAEIDILDLAFPATTDATKLAQGLRYAAPDKMTVVFATYQSIQVIANAQANHDSPEFDLIVCDEAHRTTGATLAGEEESNFVKVHSNESIRGRKRLYMTATPRIFGESVKTKAEEADAVLASMDDEELYGKTFFHLSFSRAVQSGLLTDYKVIVLAMDEGLIGSSVQKRLADGSSELVLDDATKIVGCYKALTKADMKADVAADPLPMRRALAFCRDIKSSKLVRDEFSAVVDEFLGGEPEDDGAHDSLRCEIDHVDGTFNAKQRGILLDWLKADAGRRTCRILTNARCLSEGVDVPALDAIMFLHPRKSQIDVVQSVGRVMRKAEGKKMGYVILPVGVPPDVPPEQALNDNEKYRVVWQILNALRAHDDRFDATINKASLGQDVSGRIEIVGVSSRELEAVTAVVDTLPARSIPARADIGRPGQELDARDMGQAEFVYPVDEFSRAIMAKIVRKCGTRDYWEDWATNVAEIAGNHITRLNGILEAPGTPARDAFDSFLEELRDDLNDSVSKEDAVEMLAQHLITRPVFRALFEGHRFTDENPVSRAMQGVLDVLDDANIDKESKDLQKFYASVQMRAEGITDPEARQRLMVELYDKFFRNAFPLTTAKLGIVYTPVEIVDFIVRSVNEVLQEEFGQTLGSEGVHIIDPFTGTGTFIARLLQSGLIAREDMERKFREEIHANEIVLLAYYIAAINIESVYHGIMGGDYVPFEGICLTDTFQMYERDDLIAHYMPDNSERRKRQKARDIRVIVGNPPYSVGQRNQNDDAANVAYPSLDSHIRETYAAYSEARLSRNLYDDYIRAIRWGSDQLEKAGGGIMAYVSGSAWVERNFADGMRKCLTDEFSSIHVFHLRGDIRKNMLSKGRAGEGENVFRQGSMTGIAITVFVKNPKSTECRRIRFHDIGNDLDRETKLDVIRRFSSISGISALEGWTGIIPDEHGDWLDQRDRSFDAFIRIGDKRNKSDIKLFENFSLGVATNRDPWCYNASCASVQANIRRMIDVYNEHLRLRPAEGYADKIESHITSDKKKISWTRALKEELAKGKTLSYREDATVLSMYRPFNQQYLYYDSGLNEMLLQMPRIFPTGCEDNRVICVTGVGARSGFSCLMVNSLPNLHTLDTGQCFPLKIYDINKETSDKASDLLSENTGTDDSRAREAITEAGLQHFRTAYPDETITKEDIFYYVYGLLHSNDYRTRFANNLSKELPRIPRVKTVKDFRAFRDAGRRLGDLHVNYESAEPYPVTIRQGDLRLAAVGDPESFYRVTKMKFGGKGREKDRTTVIYNANIAMQDIPLEAYDYVVNGKPALEWVMDRQCVKTDKASGIVNDANRYAIETVGNPAYPLELFQRVITVSLETMKIVRSLPKLDIDG